MVIYSRRAMQRLDRQARSIECPLTLRYKRRSLPQKAGYTATRHQREVGAGYFDDVTQTILAGSSSTTALTGSTKQQQFQHALAN